MDESKVLHSYTELELPHCLHEWCRLDVSDRAAELFEMLTRLLTGKLDMPYLDNANIRLFTGVVYRNLRYTLYPILDRVRDMRHNLVKTRFIASRNQLCAVVGLPGPSCPSNLRDAVGRLEVPGMFKRVITRTSFSITSR